MRPDPKGSGYLIYGYVRCKTAKATAKAKADPCGMTTKKAEGWQPKRQF
jgi:hypothetical protein